MAKKKLMTRREMEYLLAKAIMADLVRRWHEEALELNRAA